MNPFFWVGIVMAFAGTAVLGWAWVKWMEFSRSYKTAEVDAKQADATVRHISLVRHRCLVTDPPCADWFYCGLCENFCGGCMRGGLYPPTCYECERRRNAVA